MAPAVALLVAAGRGERLGSGAPYGDGARPKAFVTLAGKPMLQWSVDALTAVAEIERIVVALPAGEQAPAGTIGVPGGAVRSASVRAALAAAGDDCERVIVHDAARPLAPPDLFERVLHELDAGEGCDAAIAAAPVTDTVKQVADDGRTVLRTLDRSTLWAVQTPQAFRRAALERALDVDEQLLAAATDDAWLIERAGGRVRVVPAGADNLKVTTPLDLSVAERLLAR
ncbi:MAG TPA: 2-C-methyl-D-erythritol 4-phosphate cytidylyltransferase [Solirubrobacteraceae bacterium]|nr:2-C-methyl-D-erythritol 4-phosphate cytidylyltransferase [Solirubrobacteraceae bacterium]